MVKGQSGAAFAMLSHGLIPTQKRKNRDEAERSYKLFLIQTPELPHLFLPVLQVKWGCVREHEKRLKSRETPGLHGVVKREIWNSIGKEKGGATKKPKNCSVKRSEQGLTPSRISIGTQGQRRRKVEGKRSRERGLVSRSSGRRNRG